MKGMSYKEFCKHMIDNAEIEFAYQGIDYMFIKEPLNDDAHIIKLSIWSGEPLFKCCYEENIKNAADDIKEHIDKLVNIPIFPDNKSIREVRNDIEITCIFG